MDIGIGLGMCVLWSAVFLATWIHQKSDFYNKHGTQETDFALLIITFGASAFGTLLSAYNAETLIVSLLVLGPTIIFLRSTRSTREYYEALRIPLFLGMAIGGIARTIMFFGE